MMSSHHAIAGFDAHQPLRARGAATANPVCAAVSALVLLLTAGLAFAASPVAGEAGDDGQRAAALAAAADLQKKMEAIDEQYRKLMEKVAEVETQRRELELTLAKVRDLDGIRGGADTTGAPAEVGAEQKAEKEAADNQRPEIPRLSPDVGGVLTPKGRLVIEPSIQYVYASVNSVDIEGAFIPPAVLIGLINIEEADRDTYIASLTARYGLTNRLEIETRVPYVFRDDTTRSRRITGDDTGEDTGGILTEDVFFGEDGNDWGDVELSLRYQFQRRSASWPFITGNLRFKADTGTDPYERALDAWRAGFSTSSVDLPTGSGFWSISPSVTFLYPSDPVVFFGNLGYLFTLDDDKGSASSPPTETDADGVLLNYGKVDPGDAIRLSIGMGFSLNDRSSFSLGYSLDIYDETRVAGFSPSTINGSDFTVGKFNMGYSLKMGDGAPLNLAIGIGATEDAPDSDITFRVPFNFLE